MLKIIEDRPAWLLVIALVVFGFLAFLVISLVGQNTDLKVLASYELPDLVEVSGLSELGYDYYAVAVDGTVVATDGFGGLTARPTASTAKMILGLAIMRAKPFSLGERGESLKISTEDYERYIWYVNNGGSNTAVEVDEEISEYDALMSVFLPSSNNMADTLAVWAFGSLEDYRDYATEMLHEWGIKNTTIGEDASGFSYTTVSTASDLVRIGQKVLEDPVLSEIVRTEEYEVPVAGAIRNTNLLLGESGIVGVKTGYIGDASGYCLITGYLYDGHIVTVALMGAENRGMSFNDSLTIINMAQDILQNTVLVQEGQVVGYYDSWWTGKVPIRASTRLDGLGWKEAESKAVLDMDGAKGLLRIKLNAREYEVPIEAESYVAQPSFLERLTHIFGWQSEHKTENDSTSGQLDVTQNDAEEKDSGTGGSEKDNILDEIVSITNIPSDNCTIKYGYLMLINPNFTVDTDFIDARRNELVSLYDNYGIVEGNQYNGDNLLDAEAAKHLNEMNNAYAAEYPGHAFETRSCYRARGTTCGRMCAATGTSDHHTGLTCDLLDPDYGTSLDTDTYEQHIDWQWLYANSYKYGFIDRFPEAWAGGLMSEPLNVDENGSTGLFETWHYRYVGVKAATEIANGKYNNGNYDSLEHYLKALGLVRDLKNAECE